MHPVEASMVAPLALVFTDVVGSSAAKRAASLGADPATRDEAYLSAVQSRHLRLVRECIANHGGTEIMTIGDAFFLTFENASEALLCAAEIQLRLKAQPIMTAIGPLSLRIGIHVGHPKFFENSWHGTDVDTAARAESVASSGQIVLTAAARQQIGELAGVRMRALGNFTLKGIGDVALWDADYDQHGQRKAQMVSIEGQRRQKRIQILWQTSAAVLVLLMILGGYSVYRQRQNAALTVKDKLVLAEPENRTGDPIFDATLETALTTQLQQSPLLQLVSGDELDADMLYLHHPMHEVITPALARQVGQRESYKAYITSSLTRHGEGYSFAVDAMNCATGATLAHAQADAADRNHVLAAIATTTDRIRRQLGESLATVKQLSTPWGEVTTNSFEAFHAYALGEEARAKGSANASLAYYQKAADLDPSFAMAWARLGVEYRNEGQTAKALPLLSKAYDLRERASERERLYIVAMFADGRGNLPDGLKAYRELLYAYPRDPAGVNNTGALYANAGDNLTASRYTQKAVELEPWDVTAKDNAAIDLLAVDDAAGAKKYIDASALVSKGNDLALMLAQAVYAFETGDADWKSYLASASKLSDGFQLYAYLSTIHYVQGTLVEARSSIEQAASSAVLAKSPDAAGNALGGAALAEAEFGNCTEASSLAKRALKYDASITTLPFGALALALCGQGTAELAALRRLAEASPENTLINAVYVPQTAAAIALAHHRPQDVPALLASTHDYSLVSDGPAIEAEALLELHRPAEALAALQPGLKYRFEEFGSGTMLSHTMCTLLAARAEAMAGDKAAAIATYRHLIVLWKDADPDLPQLLTARKEYAALQ